MSEYEYQLEFAVRNYECDLQGIVNNAVYLCYLEHARHEFLKTKNVDFAKLHEQGVDAVVARIEVDYKYPLKSGDKFFIKLKTEYEGKLRMIFYQDIYRIGDDKLILKAKVIGACLKNSRPVPFKDYVRY